MITVKIDQKQIDNLVNSMNATAAETLKALAPAFGRCRKIIKQSLMDNLSKQTGLSEEFLDGHTKASPKKRIKLRYNAFSLVMSADVRPINLIRFDAVQYPKKSKGRKFLNGGVKSSFERMSDVKGAFIVTGTAKGGRPYKTVFKRSGKSSLPIEPVNVLLEKETKSIFNELQPKLYDIFYKSFTEKLQEQVNKRQ